MLFHCFYWTAYSLVGPLAGQRQRDAPYQFDEYSSMRSPIDPSQSDFLHIHSSWIGLRLDPLRHQTYVSPTRGLGAKISMKNRAGVTITRSIFSMGCFGSYPREYSTATMDLVLGTSKSFSTSFVDHAFTSDGRYAVYREVYYVRKQYPDSAYYQVRYRFFSQTNRKQHRYQPYTANKYLYGTDNQTFYAALESEVLNRTPDDDLEYYERSLSRLQLVTHTNEQGILDCDVFGELVPPRHHYSRSLELESVQRWGDLTLECVRKCTSVKSDPYMIAQDVVQIKQLVSMIPKSPADFKNPKYWANLFLAFKFGVTPTVGDGVGIYDDYQATLRKQKGRRIANTWATSTVSSGIPGVGSRTIVRTAHLRYSVEDDPITRTIRFLYDYNLMPTVNLAWEFIPFSFVVDWCVDVDTFLDSLLNYNAWYSTLNVISVSYSDAETITAAVQPEPGVLLPASGTTSRYTRYICSEAISPTPRFDGSSLSVDNVITGSVLFIQRAK